MPTAVHLPVMTANPIRPRLGSFPLMLLLLLLLAVVGQRNSTAQVDDAVKAISAPAPSVPSARFEVATIKPSPVDSTSGNIRLGGHQVILEYKTIEEIVELAYQVHGEEVVGGPVWFRTQHFDISGVPDFDAVPDLPQLQEMLKDLLVARCGLTLHREQKEIPVYVLSVDEKGPRLSQSSAPAQGSPTQTGGHQGGERVRTFKNNSISDFILGMQTFMDRPIIDKTGLTGHYDFKLTWSPDDSSAGQDNAGPDLFTALREQLGLKLKAEHGRAEILVVDAVQAPSAN